jgi:hypothetical protein
MAFHSTPPPAGLASELPVDVVDSVLLKGDDLRIFSAE